MEKKCYSLCRKQKVKKKIKTDSGEENKVFFHNEQKTGLNAPETNISVKMLNITMPKYFFCKLC